MRQLDHFNKLLLVVNIVILVIGVGATFWMREKLSGMLGESYAQLERSSVPPNPLSPPGQASLPQYASEQPQPIEDPSVVQPVSAWKTYTSPGGNISFMVPQGQAVGIDPTGQDGRVYHVGTYAKTEYATITEIPKSTTTIDMLIKEDSKVGGKQKLDTSGETPTLSIGPIGSGGYDVYPTFIKYFQSPDKIYKVQIYLLPYPENSYISSVILGTFKLKGQ